MQEEIWKDVPNYEGLYQVSNLGNVKSLSRLKESGGNKVSVNERILKGRQSGYKKNMYLAVALCNNKHTKQYKIHVLVAMAFLNHTPCGFKLVVDHINDNKLDNRLENLQIVTQRENSYKTQGKWSSNYKGVSWCRIKKKWRSRIRILNKEVLIGYFTCELAASLAYQNKLKEINERA
jgi:hypothetical protein